MRKKSVLILLVIAIVAVFLTACNSNVTENVANFSVGISNDLAEIADIYIDYSKTDDTKSMYESGSEGEKIMSPEFSFSYVGLTDEIGMKVTVKLKDVYTLSDNYDLTITLKSVMDQKGVSDTLKKVVYIDELEEDGTVAYYFFYDMTGDKPVLSENQPVDWSEEKTPVLKDEKKYEGKYCIADSETGRDAEKVSAYFLKRMINAAEDYSDDTNVFIIDGKKINSLTDKQYSDVVKLAARDGKIVLLDTNKEQFGQFAGKFIDKAGHADKSSFSEEFRIFLDRFCYVGSEYVNFDSAEDEIGIIAICNSSLFIVDDDKPNSEGEEQINYAGHSLNYLVSWLKDDYKDNVKEAYERAKAAANGMDLDSLESAQIVDSSFTAAAYNNWRERRVPVHTRYYIWTAHSLDSGHDFYIIEQEVQAENDKWYCKVQNKKTWDKSTETPGGHTGSDWGSYGPYMAYLTMDNKIQSGDDTVVVSEYAPTTQSGSTSVSTGVNFSLGGNIGLSEKGPSGGVTGSVMFTRSETVSIPQVKVEVAQDGANLKFKYLGSDIQTHERAFHWSTHDLAEGERVNAMEVKNRWIWDIDNKNTDKTYKFSGRIALTSHCMEYHDKTFSWETWTYQRISDSSQTITLLPPSRFSENYLLQADTPDDWDYAKKQAFQNFMVDKFRDWYSNTNMYSPKGSDLDTIAVEYFDAAMKTFEENKNVIATAGFYGTFNFYIQKTDGGILLKSQELVVEK